MSEQIAKSLMAQIEEHETQWKQARLNVRYLKKKGLDAEVPDDLRIAHGVWLKDAKRRRKHAFKVVMYKAHVLELFTAWKGVKSDTLAQLQKYSDVKDQVSDPNLQPFLQALHELETEGRIHIEREGGTSHEVARDIVKEPYSEMYQNIMVNRTKYTVNTPSHGFGGAVCPNCVVRKLSVLVERLD